jgi:putative nucleotidyltransferase with HDIG domain
MLIHRAPVIARFTRSDATRLGVAAGILMLVMTAILGADILPEETLQYTEGEIARSNIVAPRATAFDSEVRTEQARTEAREGVPPQYTYTTDAAIAIAAEQATAFDTRVDRVDTAFGADLSPEERASLLEVAIPDLSDDARATLVALNPARWAEVRTQAGQVLQRTLLLELRETDVPQTRTQLAGRMAGGLDATERMLAAELISPLIVPNSSFDQALTDSAGDAAAAAVDPVRVDVAQGEIIVPTGKRLDAADIETIEELRIGDNAPDVASFAGWLLLSVLVVAMLLAWIWRFRPTLWHRNNVIVLIGLLLAGTTLALKFTAGRPILGYFLPTAAIGMLLAILLDASVATIVMAVIAIIGGALNDNSLEFAAYTFLGGMSGIIAVRKGDRLQVFVQAAIAIFVVNIVVVSIFSLLGARDIRGVLEMWFASGAAAIGSSVAAVGTFAVLGSVFGILTVFQLLELANPSQPLLRRLLVETPGTYHHSLMVGNLAERAAEAIGADPLVTRVAAYYHDVGKLSNPLAFIENQAGGENIHDQLEPEVSAQVLKQHVADGIDTAYAAKLPKALIAFIPQHHGTAIMSYFNARARERAAEPYGGLLTPQGEKAAEAVDERRFRHAGPKPQTREAALIMLADGVEASVRSLAARDEPAIRAMVGRIIDERISDGQFDECDLTLRDLERIRNAFVQQLLGMYHTRIAYPQNTVVELESRRIAAAGGAGGGAAAPDVTGGPGAAGGGDAPAS